MSDGSYVIVSQFGRHEVRFGFGDGEQRFEAAFADRLEAEDYRRKKSQPQAAGPTVRCRIAVAMSRLGDWGAFGINSSDEDLVRRLREYGLLESSDRVSFIEADVPLPQRVEPAVIEGKVVSNG